MERKQIIIAVLLLAGAFALGRYMTPEKIEIKEKIVYKEKTDTDKKTDTERNKEKHTVTVEEVRPDGTKIITTKIDENTGTKRITDTHEHKEVLLTDEKSETVEMGRNRVTISALGGLDIRDFTKPPVFGAHITKPFLGPIVIGVWGLSSATGGVSLGLQF